MAKYLLIESRDQFEYGDTGYFYGVAHDLATSGNDVTFFLIQNGVLMARPGINPNPIPRLLENNQVKVMVDEFGLRERGIPTNEVGSKIAVSDVDTLVDLLATDGIKAVWH